MYKKSKSSALTQTNILLPLLLILFFFSGFAAIIYQLMWQRMLYTVFGIDLESITIIVSVFMFGLGLGGLSGGLIAEKNLKYLLHLYIIFEILIAVFGLFSPLLIQSLSNLMLIDSKIFTFIMSFLLLSVPTFFMGATFPILVRHVLKFKKSVGDSVGILYFSNTIGASIGAVFTGFIFLNIFEINSTIYIAVSINFLIGLSALLIFVGVK